MIVLGGNCRGLGVRALTNLVTSRKPLLVGLLETKIYHKSPYETQLDGVTCMESIRLGSERDAVKRKAIGGVNHRSL